MRHRDRGVLRKLSEEIQIGLDMLGDKPMDSFLRDEMLKRALSMTVINIGELVKNISDEMRTENPQIPWKAMAGMRDIAAHKYQTLRMEDVYSTVRDDFAELKPMVEGLLRSEK